MQLESLLNQYIQNLFQSKMWCLCFLQIRLLVIICILCYVRNQLLPLQESAVAAAAVEFSSLILFKT